MFHFLLAMTPPPDGQGGGGSLVSTLIMFGAIFAIFYFMIIRPQQKRQKERDKLLSAIQKGDKIITSGGMYGTVASLEEKTVIITAADNVKLKFDRSAIATVVAAKGDKETEKPQIEGTSKS
ncbi:MAG: preprotein translocase subunit YajC [Ignavibacteriales bacterium]|nr:preprotein translocase subunit YajC [Ignavibacteriales bacterium]